MSDSGDSNEGIGKIGADGGRERELDLRQARLMDVVIASAERRRARERKARPWYLKENE